MKQLTTHSDADLIRRYLTEPSSDVELSDALKFKLNRLTRCADLIKQYGSRIKVTSALMKEFDLSPNQAYHDFQDTQEVFGSTPRNSRDFYLDILLGHITETRTKAMDKGDLKTVASCDKNMLLTIAEYFKNESIDWNKVQIPSITVGFFPQLSNVVVPENWREQVNELIEKKKKSQTTIFTDATVLKDEDESEND